MRDRGIACGFNKVGQLNPPQRELSSQIRLFVQKHPQLLREDADLSWLEDLAEDESTPFEERTTRLVSDVHTSQPVLVKTVHGSSHKHAAAPMADWQQRRKEAFVEDEDEDGSDLAETLATWLSSIYDTTLSPNSIMGSLSYFRSPEHQALLDHFDTAADIYYEPRHSVPVVSLSASMFLPKQSVWSMSEVEAQVIGRQPMVPGPTGDPEQTLDDDHSDDEKSRDEVHRATGYATTERALQQQHGQKPLLAEVFALWNDLAQDFERQNSIPGLRSGNTVIDERNFSLMR
jgi:mannosyltransferase